MKTILRSLTRASLPLSAALSLTVPAQAYAPTGVACTDPTNYCTASVNSTGEGAVISWIGTPSPVDDNFHLLTIDGPANQPIVYFYGAARTATPFGNGVLCVGAGAVGTFRLPAMTLDSAGAASLKVDFAQPPAGGGGTGMWSPGDTWYCQGWYRDPDAGGALFSLTDGLAVQVCTGGSGPYDGMALVPAGTFDMGRHVGSGHWDELPIHAVTLDAFYMDILEVSNQEYADYLNTAYAQGRVTLSSNVVYQAGGAGEALCDTTASGGGSRIIWDGSTFEVRAGKQRHPMARISWYGACAYANGRSRKKGLTPCYDEMTWDCDFTADGYRLPTEAEWEYAARGGEFSPYFMYPWGDAVDGSKANYLQSGDPFETGISPFTSPVGYYDGNQFPPGVDMANGYGLYDMAGNVEEWCGDWYVGSYYSNSPSNNPTGPADHPLIRQRVIRDGAWNVGEAYMRSADRYRRFPETRAANMGFRVLAVSP